VIVERKIARLTARESRCKHEDHVGRAPPLILKGYGARCRSRGCVLPVNVAHAAPCTNECCRVIRNWVSYTLYSETRHGKCVANHACGRL